DLDLALAFVEHNEEIAVAVGAAPHRATVGGAAYDQFRPRAVRALLTGVDDLDVAGERFAVAARATHGPAHMARLVRTHARAGKLSIRIVVVVHDDFEHVDLAAAVSHRAGLGVAVAEAVPFAAAVANQLAGDERDPWSRVPGAVSITRSHARIVEVHRRQKDDQLRAGKPAMEHSGVVRTIVVAAVPTREQRRL